MNRAVKLLSECWLYCRSTENKRIQFLSAVPEAEPGWYLWLHEHPGCYELSLLDGQSNDADQVSRFLIRYYPEPTDPVFDQLAIAEQVVRLSELFDDSPIRPVEGSECACSHGCHHDHTHERIKGIPRLADRARMNRSLFSIGELSFRFCNGELCEVSLSSQDRLIQYSTSGIAVPSANGSTQLVLPGGLDRNLPGWELAKHLFDLLVDELLPGMGWHADQRLRTNQPGQVFYWGEGGDVWSEESAAATGIRETLWFGKEARIIV